MKKEVTHNAWLELFLCLNAKLEEFLTVCVMAKGSHSSIVLIPKQVIFFSS